MDVNPEIAAVLAGQREWALVQGDCLDVLPTLEAGGVDSIVTDPPYSLGFMAKAWDAELPGVDLWRAVLRVLKPGGYLLSFGGTRTWHRLACAIEDAGFEIRDTLMWLYGTGFPKGKGCLKPAWEPVLLCRKPGAKVLPLNVDEARIGTIAGDYDHPGNNGISPEGRHKYNTGWQHANQMPPHPVGRWPANLVLDEEAARLLDEASGERKAGNGRCNTEESSTNTYGWAKGGIYKSGEHYGDSGGASRFFFCAKADRSERGNGNSHPTVKPLDLMRWLVCLVAAPGDLVLDPFAGSGSTGVAAVEKGCRFLGIELSADYCAIARKRLEAAECEQKEMLFPAKEAPKQLTFADLEAS